MKHLDLGFCSRISNKILRAGKFYLKELVCLIFNNCENITDSGIIEITSSCTNLKVLELEDCKELTDKSLKCIAANCNQLNAMNLNCISNITDEGIISLCDSCPELEILEIKDAFRVTNKAFETIARKLCYLIFLNLNCCPQLNNQSLEKIVRKCRRLKIVDIRWKCIELTETGIKRSFKANPYLEKLYTKKYTNEEPYEEYFRNECRNVKTMIYQSKNLYFKCFTMD